MILAAIVMASVALALGLLGARAYNPARCLGRTPAVVAMAGASLLGLASYVVAPTNWLKLVLATVLILAAAYATTCVSRMNYWHKIIVDLRKSR